MRPFSYRGDATAIRSRKNHFTVAYWSNLQFVMALLPPARPRWDDDSPWIKRNRLLSWSNRSLVASVGERPKSSLLTTNQLHGRENPSQKLIVAELLKNFANLLNLRAHYRAHKSRSLDPILSQMNPVHILAGYFLETHFNIRPTLPFTP
jgi:hypothetical protein